MPTQQIPQEKWNEYLAGFSAHNQRREIIVDMDSTELGPQRIISKKPLIALEPDMKDERHPSIILVAADTEGNHPEGLRHQITNPETIWVKEDDEGKVEALDIEAEEGRTIVQFV